MQNWEQFYPLLLDSVAAHIAAIDQHGIVQSVNAAWLKFGNPEIDGTNRHPGVGENYFEICRTAHSEFGESASVALEGMLSIVERQSSYFELEYACRNGGDECWLCMQVTPFGSDGSITVTHVDVTHRKILEHANLMAHQEREERSLERMADSRAIITARIFGLGPLRETQTPLFEELVQRYMKLTERILEENAYKVERNASDDLRSLAEELGVMAASARDVLDIHRVALHRLTHNVNHNKSQTYVDEGRLIALELMGYLVSYYRNHSLGNRRQQVYGSPDITG